MPRSKDFVCDDERLMAEWNWNKNNDLNLDPRRLTIGSNVKVWWKGECNHEWYTSIKVRNIGHSCPYCSGSQVLAGFNDLATRYPNLVNEWCYEKNRDVLPTNVTAGSNIRVWWQGKCGHEWMASIKQRTRGDKCPICSGHVLSEEDNSLLITNPEIAEEWNKDKNGMLTPRMIMRGSHTKVWWICKNGHEWKTTINHRAHGSQCPKCALGNQTSFPEQAIFYYLKMAYPDCLNGYTDLFNNHGMELDVYIPSLNLGIEYDGEAFHRKQGYVKEYKKYCICKENSVKLIRIRENIMNDDRMTSDILLYAKESLDETIAQLSDYIPNLKIPNTERDRDKILTNYQNCVYEHSLMYQNPALASEWNEEKNVGLTPDMFAAKSNVQVWWKCKLNHEWQASIDSRSRGTNCPYCANSKVLTGFNDLAFKRPDLMKEWNYDKNKELNPERILPGSGKKAWWICSNGHEWYAEISSRNKGHGCPNCARIKKK